MANTDILNDHRALVTILYDHSSERALVDHPVELTIQTVLGNCHSVSAFGSWSVHRVKNAIFGLTNHVVGHQRLLSGTRALSDTEILQEFLPSKQTHHEMFLIISIDKKYANIVTSLVLGRVGLQNVNRKYQEDLYVVGAAVRQNGLNLEHAHGAARKDKTIVSAAVVQNGFALSFAPQKFSSEPDVVIAAVSSSAFSITLASQSLQSDCDFAIKAVHANPFVSDYLEPHILDNVEFRRAFTNANDHVPEAPIPNLQTSDDQKLPTQVNLASGKSFPGGSGSTLSQIEEEVAAAFPCHETKKSSASKKCNPLRWLRACISTQQMQRFRRTAADAK